MDFSKDYIEPEKKLLGVWIKPSEDEDVEFRVRPYSQTTYYLAIGEEMEVRKIELDAIADKIKREAEYRKIINEKLVETFLLDWKNVSVGGEQIPFSVEKATNLLLGSETFMKLFNKAVNMVTESVEKRDEEVEKN